MPIKLEKKQNENQDDKAIETIPPKKIIKWDYRDGLREMTKVITDLEIIVEDEIHSKLTQKFQKLFEKKNQVRIQMIRAQKENQLIDLSQELVLSMHDLNSDSLFKAEFKFYSDKFQDVINKVEMLKQEQDDILF